MTIASSQNCIDIFHVIGLKYGACSSSLREKLFYNKKCTIELVSDYSLEIGEVVQLDIYKGGRDREQDFANSGKWVIGRVERTYKNSEDKMTTKLTLFTDSDGEEL